MTSLATTVVKGTGARYAYSAGVASTATKLFVCLAAMNIRDTAMSQTNASVVWAGRDLPVAPVFPTLVVSMAPVKNHGNATARKDGEASSAIKI